MILYHTRDEENLQLGKMLLYGISLNCAALLWSFCTQSSTNLLDGHNLTNRRNRANKDTQPGRSEHLACVLYPYVFCWELDDLYVLQARCGPLRVAEHILIHHYYVVGLCTQICSRSASKITCRPSRRFSVPVKTWGNGRSDDAARPSMSTSIQREVTESIFCRPSAAGGVRDNAKKLR